MRYSVAACCLTEARSEFMSLRLGLVGPVNLGGLDQLGAALVAEFTVSGKLGANAGKRLLLPTQFFASNAKASLASQPGRCRSAFRRLMRSRTASISRCPAR